MGFGLRLKKKRVQLGWTQEEMARRLDVSQPMIHKWERDRADVKLSTVLRTAAVLGVSPNWLAFGSNGVKTPKF